MRASQMRKSRSNSRRRERGVFSWVVLWGILPLLLGGCGQEPEAPTEPAVVRKEIARPVPAAPKAETVEVPAAAAPVESEKEEAVPAAASDSTPVAVAAAPAPAQVPSPEAGPAPEKAAEARPQPAPGPARASPRPEQPAAEAGKTDEGAAGVVAEVEDAWEEVAEFTYDPRGRIDPFASLILAKAAEEKKRKVEEKRERPKTPLELFDVSQLRLTGIVRSSSKGDSAIVQDASGKGYVIKTGTYIGTNSGRVILIMNDRVIVEEMIEDLAGRVRVQQREMKLEKVSGEG